LNTLYFENTNTKESGEEDSGDDDFPTVKYDTSIEKAFNKIFFTSLYENNSNNFEPIFDLEENEFSGHSEPEIKNYLQDLEDRFDDEYGGMDSDTLMEDFQIMMDNACNFYKIVVDDNGDTQIVPYTSHLEDMYAKQPHALAYSQGTEENSDDEDTPKMPRLKISSKPSKIKRMDITDKLRHSQDPKKKNKIEEQKNKNLLNILFSINKSILKKHNESYGRKQIRMAA
jgi:hypothetical protein